MAQALRTFGEVHGSSRLFLVLLAVASSFAVHWAEQPAHTLRPPPRLAGASLSTARQPAAPRHRRFRGHGRLKRRPRRAERGQRRASPAPVDAAALRRTSVGYPGVFYLRGHQSRLYLRPGEKGDLIHEDVGSEKHVFALVPGIGPRTGLVKLFNLAADSSLMLTVQGWLGCFAGDYEEHYWAIVEDDGERFKLEHHGTGLRIFSNADGRLGYFAGEDYDDQYFICEDRAGYAQQLYATHGSYGLQDSGFKVMGGFPEPTVYTDAFHAGHYIFDQSLSQLFEVREGLGMQELLSWGTALDLRLPEMSQPHAWAVERIPLLRRLETAGVISTDHPDNEVYLPLDFRDAHFDGVGLPPSNAIRFALPPVSDGRPVPLERDWLRAWHGPSLHSLESIAQQGLRCDRKGRIFLSPSFQYPFCIYSVPDLLVDGARFRLVLEVRVRPGSYWEHGDHYRFCATQQIERCVPEDCMEWELVNSTSAVQVVGLVLKQLRPDHPTLRHDTNVRHAGRSLLHL